MNRAEFVRKWNLQHGLRVILFDGGSIFATDYFEQRVKKMVAFRVAEYDEIVFRKDVGGVLIETGTCRLDKIKEVL